MPTEDDLSELERKLELFEKDAQAKVLEQLEWALEEKRDKRAQLMLVAAEYFPQGSNNCPVCTQDLESVPQIKEQLDRLRPLAGQTHLKQELDNLDLSLRNGLGQIVALMLREEGRKTLCGRILSDWSDLKERGFKGFLLEIAEKFDERVQNIAEETQVEEEIESVPLAEGYFKDFPAAFYELD